MAQPYKLELRTGQLRVLIERTRTPGSGRNAQVLGRGVRKAGAIVQARAVRNVTGYPVVYEGGVFRVQVQTGTLRGAIELEWPYGTAFQARVYVNGARMTPAQLAGGYRGQPRSVSEYAGAIEWGHAAIDLKLTMKGKTVPFFAAKAAKARGPYSAVGVKPLDQTQTGFGTRWQSETLNRKLAAQGKGRMIFTKQGGKPKGGGSYWISFRKVGNEGWIIPEMKPRPFMRAALEGTKQQAKRAVLDAALEMLDPSS